MGEWVGDRQVGHDHRPERPKNRSFRIDAKTVVPAIGAVALLASCTRLKSDPLVDEDGDGGALDATDASAEIEAPAGDEPREPEGSIDASLPVEVEDGIDGSPADGADAFPEACSSDCDVEGDLACTGESEVTLCVREGACLKLHQAGACPQGAICCHGVCVSNDRNNCFSCEHACSDLQPICDAKQRDCGCDDGSCATMGLVCDGVQRKCVPRSPPPGYDYYVDATGNDGDGSSQRPFQLLSSAITVATAKPGARIYAAPGTYDLALGETFPLVLRGGLSLTGAGKDRTLIVGSGLFAVPDFAGAVNGLVYATVVIGDSATASVLSDVSVTPSSAVLSPSYGVVCDRGPASQDPLAPTTHLASVVVGPGFTIPIVATASLTPALSSCNLAVTTSTVVGGDPGLAAVGCDRTPGTAQGSVSVQLGDGTESGGNIFMNQDREDDCSFGVMLSDCVGHASLTNNTFQYADGGVWIVQPAKTDGAGNIITNDFQIVGNRFQYLSNVGLSLRGASILVSEFVGNSFYGVSTSRRLGLQSPGIALVLEGLDEPGFARIAKARSNTFVGNDVGLVYRGGSGFRAAWVSDFGDAEEDGNNDFRCNSAPPSASSGFGADIAFAVPTLEPVVFPFDGNCWDRVPPSESFGGTIVNGTDVVVIGGGSITASTTRACSSVLPCPAGATP